MSSSFGRVFRSTEIISIELFVWQRWDGIELWKATRTPPPRFTLSLWYILCLCDILYKMLACFSYTEFLVYTTDWNWLNLFIKLRWPSSNFADQRSWFQSKTLQKVTHQWLTLDIAFAPAVTHNTSQQRCVHACITVAWNFFFRPSFFNQT